MSVNTRPIGQLDSQGRLNPSSYQFLAFQGDYTGGNLVYKGYARPGSSTAAPVWQISKQVYDGSNNLIAIQYPTNSIGEISSDFVFIWANRASYTYG